MKNVFLFLLGIALISCDNDDTAKPSDNAAFSGAFVSAVHPTSGTVTINEDETTMAFADFKTDSGPDLNIYLVSDISNITGDFIDLGDIQGVDGSYNYSLPPNTDYTVYKYVVIWCVEFDVNFGYAELEEE